MVGMSFLIECFLFFLLVMLLLLKVIEFKIFINSIVLNIIWCGWNDGNSFVIMFVFEYKVKSEKWEV